MKILFVVLEQLEAAALREEVKHFF